MTDMDVPSPFASPALAPDARIGPYRILQVLGVGGMGVVYEADETGPVRRRVALKVLKEHLASKEVLARFHIEQQALAVMSHPGIAKVLHAGTTEAGDPYFAMEIVRGPPITQYCDQRRLGIAARLELFVQVCEAVQHAHQKGVIHRDLKPSNVLVAEDDGKAQPKIIDFGIAKALGQQLTERTLVTRHGEPVGTAAYMSPEQAESSGLDVDTRTDIYSLGVLLYELLVGRLPIDPAAVGVHAFIARLATGDTIPPVPSARLATLGPAKAEVAAARGTDPGRLVREIAGDLDWIVMTALDPDRGRRYATASGLAMDIGRHLANEPIIARRPGTAYRAAKFARRHRAGVIAAGVTSVAVLVGAVAATVGMVRATRAERRAAEEAAAAKQVTDFLVELFRVADPSQTPGTAVTARELLDRGAGQVRALAAQPMLQSRITEAMGRAYAGLGVYPEARSLLEEALRARERLLGPRDTLVAQTAAALGSVASSRGDFADAERHLLRALAIREAALGPSHPGLAGTTILLGGLRTRQGRLAEAESLYLRAIPMAEAARPRDEVQLARALVGLGVVYFYQQRLREAEPLLRDAQALQERALGRDHLEVARTMNNLGGVYWALGRYPDALPLYQRAGEIFATSLGPLHPDVASNANNLAETYWKLKRYAEAEPLFRRALAILEQRLAPGHPSIAVTLNGLASLLRDQGRLAEAEPLYRRALAIRERSFGDASAATRETLREYAQLLRMAGRAGEAEAMEQRAKRAEAVAP